MKNIEGKIYVNWSELINVWSKVNEWDFLCLYEKNLKFYFTKIVYKKILNEKFLWLQTIRIKNLDFMLVLCNKAKLLDLGIIRLDLPPKSIYHATIVFS